MIEKVLKVYGIDPQTSQVESLTSGLINNTWKVTTEGKEFIVQRINHQVFRKPFEVAANIRMIDRYLKEHSSSYLFVSPVPNLEGEDIYYEEADGYFRVFPYIKGSHTINTVSTPHQAFEAALQFGKFTRLLSGFEARLLHTTIPDFHNLTLRYSQFESALANGDRERIRQSADLIACIKKYSGIVEEYERIRVNARARQRVTHHDTKISNVLFDDRGKGLCVIDLDTVMSGYFISDMGDMMRTYLSPANEEEKDFDRIEVREDFFKAIVNGYLSSMGDELTTDEQGMILYSGSFLVYMQAIRFLTDHLNRDVYYGARYEDQNFVRAGNQLVLLERLDEKSAAFGEIIASELQTRSHFIF
ncbi:MAG: aminoglycoside phosphotransferase family protein [Bacteroidota bacterium]|nr:aminoglycoside phosphotransferase family protein [Bacteroidota bacterium]